MSAPKILSVDDSRMIHTLINKGFAPYDVQMVFASNGAEGLEAAARERPDVILLDVTMPVMDGVECLSKLKADPALKDIPVIMLTAEAGKENVLKIAKMGVRDYIVKPFTESAVIDRVSRIVDLKPKGAAPAAAPAPVAAAPSPSASAAKKKRTVLDAIKILVVDEHPAIIESIQKSVAKREWMVIGSPGPEAAQSHIATSIAAEETPDVILISLAFANKAAHKFFVAARSHPAMKEIPVIGLAVKTATFEQAEAKDVGFEGVITKPLDLAEIPDRIARAMDLDITPVFYSAEGDVQVVTIPQDLSETGSIDLSRQSRDKIAGFVNAGFSKLLVDLSGVTKVEVPIIRAVASIVHECNRLDIAWRFVGTDVDTLPNFPTIVATNLKVASLKDLPNPFKGLNLVDVHPTRAAAITSF
jgi:two-component system, cell cycle response regulator